MAKNMKFTPGNQLQVALASVTSGDPVVVGQLPAVALTSTDTAGNVTVKTDGVFALSVKGVDGSGNKAVAIGDIIYHVDADTPKLSVKSAGVRFGYALEAVTSGATKTIKVKLGY
jgi:predicted RecA/RadA family phage recombinase